MFGKPTPCTGGSVPGNMSIYGNLKGPAETFMVKDQESEGKSGPDIHFRVVYNVDCNDYEDEPDPSLVKACSSLTSVTFEAGSCLKIIGDRAFASSGITKIVIPASVEYIGAKCFGMNNDAVTADEMIRCELTSIEFEPGSCLKTIGDTAFLGAQIKEIEIPASVECLGNNLFGGSWDCHVNGEIDYCPGSVERVTFERGSHLKVLGSVFQAVRSSKKSKFLQASKRLAPVVLETYIGMAPVIVVR